MVAKRKKKAYGCNNFREYLKMPEIFACYKKITPTNELGEQIRLG